MLTKQKKPPKPTLGNAIAEAKVILARAELLDAMPERVRELELAEPGSIYAVDREIAVKLLKFLVPLLEGLDPEMIEATRNMDRLEQVLARRR